MSMNSGPPPSAGYTKACTPVILVLCSQSAFGVASSLPRAFPEELEGREGDEQGSYPHQRPGDWTREEDRRVAVGDKERLPEGSLHDRPEHERQN